MMFYSSVFLAQEGSQAASEVIQQSLELSQATIESWQRIWDAATDSSTVELWAGLVNLGIILATFSIIYVSIRYAGELSNTTSWSKILEMFLWPITVLVFLAGNGRLLSQVVRIIRGVGYAQVSSILEIQLAGVTFRQAIDQVRLNKLSIHRIQQIYSECVNLTGQELNECWQSKQAEAQEILNQIGVSTDVSPAQNFLDTLLNFTVVGGIRDIGSFISGGFVQVLQDKFIPALETILYAVQWTFVNILEASLLLTAVCAPIALGLSILPVAGKPIFAWASAMISLIGAQMGYNILVGIMAIVLVETTGEVAEVITDLGFLFFAAVFSPYLAIQLAKGGGIALYESISRKAAQSMTVVTDGISTATNLALLRGI